MAGKERFPWVSVSAMVAAGVVAVVTWIQVPEAASPQHPAGPAGALPALGLTRMDLGLSKDLLSEKLEAYDPAPLFIPSPMNSNEPPLPEEARPGARGPFASLPPALTKTGSLSFPSLVPTPGGAVEALRLTRRGDAPLTIGRNDTLGEPLGARLGRMGVVDVANGSVVLTLDLPPAPDFPEGDWQPLELMGAVTQAGQVGALVVTTSSGIDQIDDYFRAYLAETLHIAQRLSPGIYVFHVGP